MDIQDLIQNCFLAGDPFVVVENVHQEESDSFQLCNKKLEKLKEQGFELHYEVQFSKKSDKTSIRLDGHVFPYWKFKNKKTAHDYKEAVKKHYSEASAEEILRKRKALKDIFLGFAKTKDNGYNYGKNSVTKHLWLVCKDLEANDPAALLAEVYRFIADTYPDLVAALEKLGIGC